MVDGLSVWSKEILVVATVIQAFTAVLVVVLLFRQSTLMRMQANSQRLDALRDLFARHNGREISELRQAVRHELPKWVNGRSIEQVRNDPEFRKHQQYFEEAMNYYEYLGTITQVCSVDEEIIVDGVHNSAVDIWDNIYLKYYNYFLPEDGRVASDYAGSFRALVSKAKSYRARRGIRTIGDPPPDGILQRLLKLGNRAQQPRTVEA